MDNRVRKASLQVELRRKYEQNFHSCAMRKESLQIELEKVNYINRCFLPSPNGSSYSV